MAIFNIPSLAITYLIGGILFLTGSPYLAQPQREIDSLKVVLQASEPGDSAYIMNQLFIGTQFFFLHETDSAQHYIEQAWDQLSPKLYPELTIYALNRKGILAGEQGQYPKSIEYLQEALVLSQTHQIKKGIKIQYLGLGRTYLQLEEWDVATDYFFKGLEIAEELGDLEDQYIALHNISIPFSYSHQHKQALKYKRMSLSIPGFRVPPVRKIASYMGMASNFKELAAYDSAAIYGEKALHLAKELKHVPFQVRIYSGLANNAIKQEAYSQALAYLEVQASLLNPQDMGMLGSHLVNKAYALFGLKRYEEAFQVSREVQEIAESTENLMLLNNTYYQLYTFYKELNQSSQALDFREKLRTSGRQHKL